MIVLTQIEVVDRRGEELGIENMDAHRELFALDLCRIESMFPSESVSTGDSMTVVQLKSAQEIHVYAPFDSLLAMWSAATKKDVQQCP